MFIQNVPLNKINGLKLNWETQCRKLWLNKTEEQQEKSCWGKVFTCQICLRGDKFAAQ